MKDKTILLTVHALSGDYVSAPSQPVVVSKEDFVHMCKVDKMTADESEVTSSATSLSSLEEEEEEKVVYDPATRLGGNGVELQPQEVDVVTVESNGLQDDETIPGNGRHNGHTGKTA